MIPVMTDFPDYGEFIGEGFSRRVHSLLGNSVVKFAKNDYGVEANRTECLVWEKLRYEDFLCPVIGRSDNYAWIVMPRIDRVSYPSAHHLKEKLSALQDHAESYGISDLHPGNIGMSDCGSLFVIDYGNLDPYAEMEYMR